MNARDALRASLAATALSLALTSSAHAAKAVRVSCGDTITKDTKLANDLTNCPGDGIVIGADAITLDLNGHTVDGTAVPFEECDPDCAFSEGLLNEGHDRVTIKGGSVREFVYGVHIADSADNNRLSGLSVSDQGDLGIAVARSTGVRVEQSSVVHTAIAIITIDSHDVRIENNVMAHNGADQYGNGIWAIRSDGLAIEKNLINDSNCAVQITEGHGRQPNLIAHNRVTANNCAVLLDDADHNQVTDNDITQSGTGVTIFGSDNTVTDNHIVGGVLNPDGWDYGIEVAGGEGNQVARNEVRETLQDGIRIAAFEPDVPTLDNIIRDNRVRGAGVDGFSVATAGEGTVSGTLIKGNLASDSGDDGFDVRSASTTLTGNTANDNHDLGIEAVLSVTDGGGNRARANGNPLQCTNIFCR